MAAPVRTCRKQVDRARRFRLWRCAGPVRPDVAILDRSPVFGYPGTDASALALQAPGQGSAAPIGLDMFHAATALILARDREAKRGLGCFRNRRRPQRLHPVAQASRRHAMDPMRRPGSRPSRSVRRDLPLGSRETGRPSAAEDFVPISMTREPRPGPDARDRGAIGDGGGIGSAPVGDLRDAVDGPASDG